MKAIEWLFHPSLTKRLRSSSQEQLKYPLSAPLRKAVAFIVWIESWPVGSSGVYGQPDVSLVVLGTTAILNGRQIPQLTRSGVQAGYRSYLRPIPRHTIPPEYPLSSAPPPCISGQQEDGSKRFFGEEWEDETWWDEVVSSMSSLECASQSQESNQVSYLALSPFNPSLTSGE